MLKKLGIDDLHFHDLRHEAITRFFELGTLDIMEIAAISGHKSLSMLKRYTHLRASRLVHKLEGSKNKAKLAVISHLIPYPAEVRNFGDRVIIRVLDFDGLEVSATCLASAVRAAQDTLLRQIISSLKTSTPVPAPDQYLESIAESALVMIDPLAT